MNLGAICYFFGTLLFLLALCGCSSERTFYTYASKNPDKVAELCANVYQADTVYKQGETVTNTDTVTIKGDSIPCPDKPAGVKTVYVKCPDQKAVTRTITRVDTVYRDRISTLAALDTARRATQQAQQKASLAQQSKDGWRTAFWTALAVAILSIASRFIKIPFLK